MDFSQDAGTEPGLSEDALAQLAAFILEKEGVGRDCRVSVSVVDDDEIRSVNAEWRGIDAATDVISIECERPDDPDLAPGEACELGDIMMAPAYIAAQAARLDQPVEREWALLFTHGMLHLLGYDHLEDGEAEVMEAREDALVGEYLGLCGYHAATTRHRDDA